MIQKIRIVFHLSIGICLINRLITLSVAVLNGTLCFFTFIKDIYYGGAGILGSKLQIPVCASWYTKYLAHTVKAHDSENGKMFSQTFGPRKYHVIW